MIFWFASEHSGKLCSSRIIIAEKFLRTDNFSGAFGKMLFKFARNAFDAINPLFWVVKFKLDAFALKFGSKFGTGNRPKSFCCCIRNLMSMVRSLRSLVCVIFGIKIWVWRSSSSLRLTSWLTEAAKIFWVYSRILPSWPRRVRTNFCSMREINSSVVSARQRFTISLYSGETACKIETDLGQEKVMSTPKVGFLFPTVARSLVIWIRAAKWFLWTAWWFKSNLSASLPCQKSLGLASRL